jgi:short-subunit dehydrogenase
MRTICCGRFATARSAPPESSDLDWVEADLAQPHDITRLFAHARERYGAVDVLINNAGSGWARPFEQDPPAEIRALVDLNLTAQILCAQEALQDMLAQRRGLIINVASDLARRYQPRMAVYTATKFGLLGFSGSLMREVKDRGVKVVAVLSGSIDTSWGGFAPEGSRDAKHALRPDELAAVVDGLLDLPEHLIVHELVVHPSGQDGF